MSEVLFCYNLRLTILYNVSLIKSLIGQFKFLDQRLNFTLKPRTDCCMYKLVESLCRRFPNITTMIRNPFSLYIL